MKTKWCLRILWSVLSLGLLSCAVDTYESPFTKRKKVFKQGMTKSKPIKLSITDERQSSQRLPVSTSPLSQLISRRPYPPAIPGTPRFLRPGEPEAKNQSDFVFLPDVSVTCSTSDFVVRVKPAFYGLGADATELKLGSTCKSNGVLRPYGDLLFTYPLTACDSVRQSPHGYLVYKFVLHYEPSPKHFPSRAHRMDVDIQCRYQRNHHVYQLAVQPTWHTAVGRKTLKGSPNFFQIELMDDSWSRPARPQVYQLGQTVNFQIRAPHLPTGVKLYINSCYATPSSGSISSHKYTIIDNYGCMLDSRRDPGASQFISRTNKTLRFSLEAFQFTADPDTEVNIHCKLFVTSEDPGPAHKSCTYTGDRWKALNSDDSICDCCDYKCVTSKPRRAMMEGSARSGSLLVVDQSYEAEDGSLPVNPPSVSISREGEATVSQFTDELHSLDNLWESADEVQYDDEEQVYTEEEEQQQQLDEKERGVVLGVKAEPDLDELSFRERVLVEEEKEKSEVNDSNLSKEDGSGYLLHKHFSESEDGEEFEDDEISDVQQATHLNHKEGEVLRHWAELEQMFPSEVGVQRELEPLVTEGEEKNSKHTSSSALADWMVASDVERNEDSLADLDKEMTWYFTWT
ncbi:zona pellucida sperm-binding protein 3 [Micropterus dolomieu]|uniref:zona pellucida sperm-binding protein 3 n=1 Tax=Micropterus dolomieu TaxID=147949 RepID=UPI001E8E83ED|nr:zona pellucida sperm-binding protein 3 [Micropterus dolomieu]